MGNTLLVPCGEMHQFKERQECFLWLNFDSYKSDTPTYCDEAKLNRDARLHPLHPVKSLQIHCVL